MAEGYFERLNRSQQEAAIAACGREYRRMVAEGRFADSLDAYKAFGAGWDAVGKFKQDRYVRDMAGDGPRVATMMCLLLGGILAAFFPLVALLAVPRQQIIWNNVYLVSGLGVAIMLLSIPFKRRYNRLRDKAAAEFSAKWANPKTVDE